MKIQTTATITTLSVDGKPVSLKSEKNIDLEFSAIDTGGGFKDPILDFSFVVDDVDFSELKEEKKRVIELTLRDPQHPENEVAFSYEVDLSHPNKQINGRLKENELSKELIGFVLQLLR